MTVGDEHLHRLDAIVDELEAAGLQVDQVLRILGQITGRADAADTAEGALHRRLSTVTGVESVDSARQHSVGPPDAEIQ
ncbi:MAG: hypothetical protein ACTHWO_03275 [Nesterenkonia sp.]